MAEIDKYHCIASFSYSNKFYKIKKNEFEYYSNKVLRDKISDFINLEKSKIIEHAHSIEKRIELYIIPTDEFWELVTTEAEKYNVKQ